MRKVASLDGQGEAFNTVFHRIDPENNTVSHRIDPENNTVLGRKQRETPFWAGNSGKHRSA